MNLDGSGAPNSHGIHIDETPSTEDRRLFTGLYAQLEWSPVERLKLMAGARLNHTQEKKTGDPGNGEESQTQDRTHRRGSGVIGFSVALWHHHESAVWAFADARNTFKPAAIDFGPEGEGDILDPETARSVELGIRGHVGDGRFTWEASLFQMDFENLVTSDLRNGLPVLVNAGTERFKGFDLEADLRIVDDLHAQVSYAHHDSKFRDYVYLFDVPTQLAGKRLEMAPRTIAGFGLVYAPKTGLLAHVVMDYVGERYLNKRNTSLADAYTTWSAGVGWAWQRFNVRVDGWNINDTRPPVAESELGDAQYYRLPARTFRLSAGFNF